ncbi:glucosamine inositolphosphorylceramide transferase family protein [Ancylomarina sp. YFZ004]
MRIGILIKEFEALSNWELRIINRILKDPSLELALLVQDGREGNNSPKTLKNKLKRLFKSKNIIGKLLFGFQHKIENNLFKEKFTVNRAKIIKELNKINIIKVAPERKGFLDIFDASDVEKIKKHNLDIILRHEFNIIRGEILQASQYGIWSFHHADNSINRGGPAGFWEIVLNQSSVGVTLQKLTPELDGGLVIDKAFFNVHWSFVRTKKLILEASVSILFKNIKKLQNGEFTPRKSLVYFNPLYKVPKLGVVFKYILFFYSKLIGKIIEIINYKIFGIRYNCWTLFIGKGDFLNSTLFRLKPVKLPKDEFWADPFIFNYKGDNYIFFENYNYKTKKGKISCGKIYNNKLIDIVDVIEKDYHLSYPFIYKENEDIFLMPETSDNNRLEIYKCIKFPSEWELYTTAFDNEKVADAHFHNDKNKTKWLFINKKVDINNAMDSELYIYKVNSLSLKGLDLEPHKNNPVIINSKIARNGGAIFEYENEIYRPSQANIDGVYGRALSINKIEKLTISEYVEKTIVTAYPNFHKGLISMHHLHQSNGVFVIDAAYRKYKSS